MTITTNAPVYGATQFNVQWTRTEDDQALVSVLLPDGSLAGNTTYPVPIDNWAAPEADIRAALLRFPEWDGATIE